MYTRCKYDRQVEHDEKGCRCLPPGSPPVQAFRRPASWGATAPPPAAAETPAERVERLAIARASAAAWEDYFRAFGALPPAEPVFPRWDESDTFPDLLATHDPDGTPR